MPRFFFDVVDSSHSPDQDGTELPDVINARIEAVKFAGMYLGQRPDLVWDGSELRILVFDEDRVLLTTVLVSASDSPVMRARIDAQQQDEEPLQARSDR